MDRRRRSVLCDSIRGRRRLESLLWRDAGHGHREGFRRRRPRVLGPVGRPLWPGARSCRAHRPKRSMEPVVGHPTGIPAMRSRFPAWVGFAAFAVGLAIYAAGALQSPLMDEKTGEMLRVLARTAD